MPAQESYEIETFIDGSIMTISDAPWPGFTPDLLSIILVVASQAKGSVLIHQKMFESRLFFVDKLIDMGAQIILCDPHRATVIGLDKKYALRGIEMTSPDIRAGVSLLIAALSSIFFCTIHFFHLILLFYLFIFFLLFTLFSVILILFYFVFSSRRLYRGSGAVWWGRRCV